MKQQKESPSCYKEFCQQENQMLQEQSAKDQSQMSPWPAPSSIIAVEGIVPRGQTQSMFIQLIVSIRPRQRPSERIRPCDAPGRLPCIVDATPELEGDLLAAHHIHVARGGNRCKELRLHYGARPYTELCCELRYTRGRICIVRS